MKRPMGRMITLLGRKSQRCIGEALRKHGLTAAEEPFFMSLQHHDGATQEELTALVCVDKARHGQGGQIFGGQGDSVSHAG